LVKVPAFVLMQAGGWNREKKGVKCPSIRPRVKSGRRRLRQEALGGLLVARMFPTA
jgi:hypothetical protein